MQDHHTTPKPLGQVPLTTFGRSGYTTDSLSMLGDKLSKLDALLTFVWVSAQEADQSDFQMLSLPIRAEVLGLAADLAAEAHQLHIITAQERSAAMARAGGRHV